MRRAVMERLMGVSSHIGWKMSYLARSTASVDMYWVFYKGVSIPYVVLYSIV